MEDTERPAPPEQEPEPGEEPAVVEEGPLAAEEDIERAGFEKIKRKRNLPRGVRVSARRAQEEGPPPRKRR